MTQRLPCTVRLVARAAYAWAIQTRFALSFIALVSTLLLTVCASAQQSAQANPHTAPAIAPSGSPALDAYRTSRLAIYTSDFGELSRYRAADSGLQTPGAGETRVVFLGDSITDEWNLSDYFPGKSYINRGIDGQTTPQMLVRFRQDVLDLQPQALVILAGTNDIAGVTGPERNVDIESNYATMSELARSHHIRVVFASLLPVNDYVETAKENFSLRPRERIVALNQWLKDYCAKNGVVYLNYFSALLDSDGKLKKELSDDGLHPNAAGYKVMAPLAQAAIEKALRQTKP